MDQFFDQRTKYFSIASRKVSCADEFQYRVPFVIAGNIVTKAIAAARRFRPRPR